MSKIPVVRAAIGIAAALIFATGRLSNAQVPQSPAASANQNPNKLETEVITITDDAAVPDTITRKQGQFYLLLINKTHGSLPSVAFDSTTATAAQTQVLGQALKLPFLASTHRLASILNAPPGVYQIRRVADGRVLLTIHIEN